MISLLPKIDLLPEHLIDQIKAGEVIERPGNLIKEILENAVDAGATRIELIIKNNGLDLISLKDNGHGMSFEDLPLAFHRHATSKISRFEDLYQLNSFGFRGEALASIASISKLQCSSYSQNLNEGSEIRFEGGQNVYHGLRQKSGVEHGTELVIQDLFYNTPARLKFIQGQSSEKQFIKKIIYAFILARPDIEFQFKIDDEEKEIIPIHQNLQERIIAIAPKSKEHILFLEKYYENNEVSVYLLPAYLKTPVKWHNVYINGRYVLDKQLHRVMINAIQVNFAPDDYHYIVFFDVPVDSIDVNVHPSKTVIKCMSNSKMISLLTSTVKEMSSKRETSTIAKVPQPENNHFLEQIGETQNNLLQERHQYNMEGHFSPHHILRDQEYDFVWMGQYFLKNTVHGWQVVHAGKLLENYVSLKLQKSFPVIPLLVSEPYPAKNIDKKTIHRLSEAGFEMDFLSSEILVLRGIPEWMNGFPLQEIVGKLLSEQSLASVTISRKDWSSSSWEEMLTSFPESDLRSLRISFPLISIIEDKFK